MYTNLVKVYYTCKKEEEEKTNVHTPRPRKEKKNCTKNETVKCCFYSRHNYKCGVEKKTLRNYHKKDGHYNKAV